MMTLEQLTLDKDQRGAVVGQTGTGKSFLSARIIPESGRLGIIDPKRMFRYNKDVKVFHNPTTLLFFRPERFAYRPAPKYLNDLGAYNAVYEYCYKRGKGYVYTDDVVGIMETYSYPGYLKICYQMGRERDIAMLSCFQRPALVPRFLMSEASKFYIFRLTLKDDIKRAEEVCPGYKVWELADKHTFFYYDTYKSKAGVPVRLSER